MGKCAVEFEAFNKESGIKQSFYKIDDKKQDIVDKQMTASSTREQKVIVDTLIRHSSKFVGVNEKVYIDAMGNTFKRATTFLQEIRNKYYAYDKSKDKNADTAPIDRGNIIDGIYEGIIEGKTDLEVLSDAKNLVTGIDITYSVVAKIRSEVGRLRAKHPGSIIIPQLTLSTSSRVAGSLDITIVEPSGDVYIYDVKSSANPITLDWNKKTISGTFKEYYGKIYETGGTRKASKKQTHTGQLSIYKAFVEETIGKEVSGIGILPVVVKLDESDNINDISVEPTFMHEADVPLVNALKESSTKEEVITVLTDLSNTDFLQEVVRVLEKESKDLKKSGKHSSSVKIDTLLENIKLGEGMSRMSEFIEYMHEEFVTDKNSLQVRFSDHIKTFDKEGAPEDILSDLGAFEEEIELFRGVVKQLQSIYDDLSLNEVDKVEANSNIDKMAQIITAFDSVEMKGKKFILPTVAKVLSRELLSEADKVKLKETIARKEKRLALKPEGSRARKRIEGEIAEIRAKYNESEATILEALKTGNYRDVSAISYRLNPAISVNNTIIATFAKSLKRNFERMRSRLFTLEKTAAKAFEDYLKASGKNRNNVAEFNKDFVEVITEKDKDPHYALIQEFDYTEYRKAIDALRVDAELEARKAKATEKKYRNTSIESLTYHFLNKMAIERGYRVSRTEDKVVKNPYTGETIVIQQGIESTISKELDRRTVQSYEKWAKSNLEYDSNGVATGKTFETTQINAEKFPSKKYQAVINSPHSKKYYEFLLTTYRKSQENIEGPKMFNKIPYIEKVGNDRVRENGAGNWAKRFIEKTVDYLPNEEEEYGSGGGKQHIPHVYSSPLDIKDTSLDLIGSILRYTAASEKYAVQAKVEPFGKALLKQVKLKEPLLGPNDKLHNMNFGGQPLSEYFKKYTKNNTAAMLEALIDTQIYGKSRLKEDSGKIKWNKLTDAVMGFASFTQIGGKPILALSNSLAAQVSTAIDAFANEHFSTKTWFWAKAEYVKNEGSFMKDMLGTTKKSKLAQMAEVYDALQGEYFDEFGRKMSQGKAKKMMGTKAWFASMHKGEHRVTIEVMLSILKDTKIKNKAGKEISLYDAYELNSDGILSLKEDVSGELINFDAQSKIHSLNKRFNGVYNSFDKPELERHNAGILVGMYRKFIVPGVRRRFKFWGVDYEAGAEFEGYYMTFIDKLVYERGELLKFIVGKSENLTNHEIANLKRMTAEITFMILLSLIAIAFSKGDDDDDEDYTAFQSYVSYFAIRAISEISLYNFGLGDVRTGLLPLSVGGSMRSFRTPSPIYSVIEKGLRGIKYSISHFSDNENAYYERDIDYNTVFGNLGEKGDSKAKAAWAKFYGLNGQLYSVETAKKMILKDQ
jgi:hypothetical protein